MNINQHPAPNPHAFAIERMDAEPGGTAVFRLSGPMTARSMFESQSPDAVHRVLNFHTTPNDKLPAVNILDMSRVPYVDSMGLGMIVTHYAHCRGKGIRMVAAGVGPRVLELLKLTKVDALIPMAETVEDAERP